MITGWSCPDGRGALRNVAFELHLHKLLRPRSQSQLPIAEAIHHAISGIVLSGVHQPRARSRVRLLVCERVPHPELLTPGIDVRTYLGQRDPFDAAVLGEIARLHELAPCQEVGPR